MYLVKSIELDLKAQGDDEAGGFRFKNSDLLQ